MAMEKKRFFTHTFYNGKSPKCIYCGSENTTYSKGEYLPVGAEVEMLPPHLITVTCKDCKKQFEFNLKEAGLYDFD